MARVKLEVSSTFSFQTTIPIRITDVNYGGHVGNDSILSILHEVRIQFLKKFGCDEKNFFGVGLIMNDVAIEFKKELFYGDTIYAYLTIPNFEKISFDIFYKLEVVVNEKSTIAVLAKTGMVCFNYDTKRIAAVPDEAKKMGFDRNQGPF
ncbi:MAG: thioesterase family protein [Agriterribacter sp.]